VLLVLDVAVPAAVVLLVVDAVLELDLVLASLMVVADVLEAKVVGTELDPLSITLEDV